MKKIIIRIVNMTMTLLCVLATPAFAQNVDYSANDINYYDPRDSLCATGGLDNVTIANGNDNEKTIFLTLLANGFTKQQAAAVLGNLQQESGFNPKATQSPGKGRGIVQWSDEPDGTGRWNTLQKVEKGKDPWALSTQLDFMFYELNHGYKNAYQHFKAASSLEDQVNIWANEYEIAGIIGPRLQYAEAVMRQGWFINASENTSGESNSNNCSNQIGSGKFVDGFIVYDQCDPAWGDKPFGSSTICPSGCGPTAMAMIITNLTGKRVTPDVTASYATSQGMYIPNVGSSWNIAPVLSKHWNLKAKAIGANLSAINDALRSGALVIMSGSGPIPFTSGGHYIVIRAVTNDGQWLVGDSAHDKANSTKYNAQKILSNANGGSIYAISK